MPAEERVKISAAVYAKSEDQRLPVVEIDMEEARRRAHWTQKITGEGRKEFMGRRGYKVATDD